MAWIKLTSKAIYLMEGSKYIEKVDLIEYKQQPRELILNVPLSWFRNVSPPGRMVIAMDSTEEPEPLNPQRKQDVFATIIKAKDWGAEPPKVAFFEQTTPKYIVIHHTDSGNPPNDVSKGTLDGGKRYAKIIQYDHMHNPVKMWFDAGHNFLNTTGGYVLEGRQGSLEAIIKGRSVRAAHSGHPEANESPGIENEGNFMTQQMGAKQWNSLVALCTSICRSCNISPDNIKGHRDFTQTDCPGNWLYSQLPRLRQEVRTQLSQR